MEPDEDYERNGDCHYGYGVEYCEDCPRFMDDCSGNPEWMRGEVIDVSHLTPKKQAEAIKRAIKKKVRGC